jgi:hypothetical protein
VDRDPGQADAGVGSAAGTRVTMRLLRYRAAKDVPGHHIKRIRCYHGKLLGVHAQWGPRCWSWMWRLCR